MKIVFIHPDLGIGGAERLVVDAALALKSKGHQVRFVTNQFSPDHCFSEVLDFDIETIGGFPRSLFGKCNALCAYIRMCLAAICICWTGNVDLIFCDQVSACVPIFKWFSTAKVLFYCHYPDQLLTDRVGNFKKFYRFFLDLFEAWSTGKADLICVNSKFTENVVRKTFKSLANKDLHILYPTLNTAFFDKMPKTDSLMFIPENAKHVFLSINRFEVKKNIELALEAFAKLQKELSKEEFEKCFLIIAGGYDKLNKENIAYYEKLKETRDALEIPHERMIFLKSPSDRDKIELLHRCSLVIYTPTKEHFGIVPIEAMYMERCVLACNSGGPTESIVDGRTGFLRSPNAGAFSEVLLKAVKFPNEIFQLGKNGKMRVQSVFAFEAFANKLDRIIKILEK
uniref:Alpha-1,3/1,6-mannosyltransferase ALG2 n=2 Tax=Panagrolaimus sp. JU765 TaxID=591449 RepID=A0AC34QGF7_9BILA